MKKNFIVKNEHFIFDGDKLELYSLSDKNDIGETYEIFLPDNKSTLTKAVFNVANCCNLNCVYCYGNGGNYGRENEIMTLETAKKCIKEIKSKYKKIHNVFFFGGEPLANFKILKYLTESLKDMTDKFRIVTNATLLNKEIVEFLVKYDFKIYISLDGPKFINDYLRGKNTFDVVDKWINLIKSMGFKENVEISCTLTDYHRKNISISELLTFFDSYDVKYSIHTVSTTNKKLIYKPTYISLIKHEKLFIDRSLERIYLKSNNCGISMFLKNVLDALCVGKKQNEFCKELANNMSIVYDYNGEKYPCVRLLGAFKLNDPILCATNKKTNSRCKKCWAKNLCTFCTADVLLKNKTFPYKKLYCSSKTLYKYTIKKLLILLKTNEEKLNKIIENYLSNYIY